MSSSLNLPYFLQLLQQESLDRPDLSKCEHAAQFRQCPPPQEQAPLLRTVRTKAHTNHKHINISKIQDAKFIFLLHSAISHQSHCAQQDGQ